MNGTRYTSYFILLYISFSLKVNIFRKKIKNREKQLKYMKKYTIREKFNKKLKQTTITQWYNDSQNKLI